MGCTPVCRMANATPGPLSLPPVTASARQGLHNFTGAPAVALEGGECTKPATLRQHSCLSRYSPRRSAAHICVVHHRRYLCASSCIRQPRRVTSLRCLAGGPPTAAASRPHPHLASVAVSVHVQLHLATLAHHLREVVAGGDLGRRSAAASSRFALCIRGGICARAASFGDPGASPH